MQSRRFLLLMLALTGLCAPRAATGAETEGASAGAKSGGPAANNWEKLTMMAFRDNTGRLVAETPFPAGWQVLGTVAPGQPSITGPNGVKIMDQPAQNFIYTQDLRMQQIYSQSGQRLRPWPGAERLVQEDFVPALSGQGWRFLRGYEVPEVTKIDKWYSDQLYKAVPMQTHVLAFGTDWEKDDGSLAFMITHVQVSDTATLQMWSYHAAVLKADREQFEKAKKQFIFSMANTRYALEPIMAYNEAEAQKAGQSWAAHNRRMAQNQAAFEAQQRNFVNRSNAINDAIMSDWRQRDAASDRQQERFVDGIYERENAIDPATGQRHKVSIHYNPYWMNSSGEYISTNQSGYNPNLDENMNNENWRRLQKVE